MDFLGSNVISVACHVHGSLSDIDLTTNEQGINPETITSETHKMCSASTSAAQIGSLASTEINFDVEDEAMLCDEDMDGGWQPSSHVEIEKVTLENGETVWRVPRILQVEGLLVRGSDEDDTRDPAETEQEGVHGLSRVHLVPERYGWYLKTFLCTNGWKRRSRGSGQRVSHNVRAAECPAKIGATLQRADCSSKWSVVVTKHLAEHNHELSEAVYLQYSEVRRVRDPEVLAQAEQLWRGGATRRHVFEYLKERSPNQIFLMKDVHNLVQRWQSRERRLRQD
ncbi:unnamed protein product [Peronospora belbahrii]|uniref:FAR1 domain-containing protein n=1 Tax=Peronospora belbahrii TaxID=622444 RepID=A0ABN8D9T8_9STRA|nr:unnamed protein product [Peronospora belbahrii]